MHKKYAEKMYTQKINAQKIKSQGLIYNTVAASNINKKKSIFYKKKEHLKFQIPLFKPLFTVFILK